MPKGPLTRGPFPLDEPRDAPTSGAPAPEIGPRMPRQRNAARVVATGTIVDSVPTRADTAMHAVYYITDEYMRLLYVGSTSNLLRRLRQHATEREWFTPTCHVFVEGYRERDDAYARECQAIAASRPEHNRIIATPTVAAPPPDVPLRLLAELDDLTGTCSNCGTRHVHALGLCGTCYNHQTLHGEPRPTAAG